MELASEPGDCLTLGMSVAVTRLLARWCSAFGRRNCSRGCESSSSHAS